jgi:TP901 family phage tail tape measure protein
MILELVDRLSGPAKTAARRMGALTRSATKMAKSFERMTEGSRKARRALRQLGADAKKLPAVGGRMGGRGGGDERPGPKGVHSIWGRGTMATAGHEMSRFGRVSMGAMTSVMNVFADFDQKMGDVAAVTRGLAENPALFTAIRDKAKEIGEATKFTATEAASGFEMLGMAGVDAADQLKMIDHVMNLSAAGALNLSQATDIATDVMKGFNLESDQMGRIADVLAVGATSATTTVAGLGKGLSKVAPVASQLGVSLEETTAFLAAFANMGLKGGIGGRAMRRILISMVSPSKRAKKELKSLNVELTKGGKMRRPVEIFQDMTVALRKLPEAERMQKLHKIFQAFGMVGAAGAVNQFNQALNKTPKGAEELNNIIEILGQMMDGSGEAAKMAATRMNTMRGDSLKLKSALQGVAITLGEEFNEEIREGLRGLTEMARGLGQWIRDNPVLTKTLIKLWATVAALAVTFGPLIVAVDTFVKLIMITKSLAAASMMSQIGASAGVAAGQVGLLAGKSGVLAGKLAAIASWAGPIAIGTQIMLTALSEHLKEVNKRILALQETSKKTLGDVKKNIPATLAAQSTKQLGERAETLKERLAREDKRVRKEQDKLGFFDALVGRDVDMSAFQGLQAELIATQQELKRRQYGPDAGTGDIGLKIKVESDVPVRTRVGLEGGQPGVQAFVENLGLQGAGG